MAVSIPARAFFLALAASLAALASSPAAAGKRYYLTLEDVTGTAASGACVKGFHMASLWEILDFSQLKYDAKRGYTIAGSGSGPPTGEPGWIHTAGPSNANGPAGTGNCRIYSSIFAMEFGSTVELSDDWDETATSISPWVPANPSCVASFRVWCKQN